MWWKNLRSQWHLIMPNYSTSSNSLRSRQIFTHAVVRVWVHTCFHEQWLHSRSCSRFCHHTVVCLCTEEQLWWVFCSLACCWNTKHRKVSQYSSGSTRMECNADNLVAGEGICTRLVPTQWNMKSENWHMRPAWVQPLEFAIKEIKIYILIQT